MGASRFRSRDGLFLYGRVRRSDWTPIGPEKEHWALQRGSDSISSDSEDCVEGDDGSDSDDSRGYASESSEDDGCRVDESDSDVSTGDYLNDVRGRSDENYGGCDSEDDHDERDL